MIGEGELAFDTPEAAFETVRQMLTAGHYVVMVSRGEELWIVNYIYSDTCSRNDAVFMSREDFEERFREIGEAEHD